LAAAAAAAAALIHIKKRFFLSFAISILDICLAAVVFLQEIEISVILCLQAVIIKCEKLAFLYWATATRTEKEQLIESQGLFQGTAPTHGVLACLLCVGYNFLQTERERER
ncbi:hypothetical protein ACJX0J_033437, partial [Zea mays]